MRQKQRVFSLFLLSPSSRRAWIEIFLHEPQHLVEGLSPSSRRAWIEIAAGIQEGTGHKSPSTRRAWIEIRFW